MSVQDGRVDEILELMADAKALAIEHDRAEAAEQAAWERLTAATFSRGGLWDQILAFDLEAARRTAAQLGTELEDRVAGQRIGALVTPLERGEAFLEAFEAAVNTGKVRISPTADGAKATVIRFHRGENGPELTVKVGPVVRPRDEPIDIAQQRSRLSELFVLPDGCSAIDRAAFLGVATLASQIERQSHATSFMGSSPMQTGARAGR